MVGVIMLGDLIFIRGKGLIPRGIELFDGHYSHVCISMSPNNNKVLQAQGMMRSGIVPLDFSEEHDIVNLRLTDRQKSLIYPVAIQLCNFRYDYGAVAGIALDSIFGTKLRKIFNSSSRYYCSELVDTFLWAIGWLEDEEYISDITPNELYRYVYRKLNSK
jgi:hypothetical protein